MAATWTMLSQELLEERLQEARRTYKLNVGYAALTSLPAGFVELVKKYNPHITELELSSNNLVDLPDDLDQLVYLRVVRLKYNQIKRLPAVLLRLPQLMTLELSGNLISELDEGIAVWQQLRDLDLSGNALTFIPEAICNLPRLEVLGLSNNRLDALPEGLGNLPALVKLDISTNNLRQLPPSLGKLRRIQRIDAANNMLVRVPPAMGQLKPSLKELNLRSNNLDERYKAKVDEGLSRLLVFLREEEERERQAEMERLKPIGTPVGTYLEYRCKANPGATIKTDHGDFQVDCRPWIRTGHSLTQAGTMLIVFGGHLVRDGSTTSDVYWLNLERMEWHKQPCKGDAPCPRTGHCTVYDEDRNRLVIFGGRTGEKRRLADVYTLDLDTWAWAKMAVEGTVPKPREDAAACYFAGSMVVFGGYAAGGRTNELLTLDLEKGLWEQPVTSGTAPSPRQGAAICVGNGKQLFVHGGRNSFLLDDLHCLDLLEKAWAPVPNFEHRPPPRHHHQLHCYNEVLCLYGGQEDLGSASTGLYRLAVPSREPIAQLRNDWDELDTQLPFNKNRTSVLHNGSLNVLQLGSATLGKVNDEEADAGQVFWDVFKTTKLDVLRQKEVRSGGYANSNAKRERITHTSNLAPKMPRSYTSHSPKEAKMIALAQDFTHVFSELYPARRPLYLLPPNECGVPKLVCCTLRPTQLPYTELYDLPACAQFVADFISYEPLENAVHPPSHLPSPLSVLGWQAGDSFDMAVVLASLLLGAGYNAFVVVGYAPLAVTMNDQSATECPVLEAQRLAAAASAAAEKGVDQKAGAAADAKTRQGKRGDAAADAAQAAKYVVKSKVQPESIVEKERREREQQKAEAAAAAAAAADQQPAASPTPSPADSHLLTIDPQQAADASGPNNRVHAWVLVLPGGRDGTINSKDSKEGKEVTEPLFIEPSTGRRYTPAKSPYLGIEFLWNSHNYWVCMQLPQPHSDSRAAPKDVSWALQDPSKWQALLEDRSSHTRLLDSEAYADLDSGGPHGSTRSHTPGLQTMRSGAVGARPPRTPGGHGGATMARQAPGTPAGITARTGSRVAAVTKMMSMAAANPQTVTPTGNGPDGRQGAQQQHDNTPPRSEHGGDAASSYAGESAVGGPNDDVSEPDIMPDLPPSWVPKLTIPRDVFDMRCPKGSKVVQYWRCKHEVFAQFGECERWDGLTERLTRFADDGCAVQAEVVETFKRRKDKLRERRSLPLKNTIVETFDRGSAYALREIHTVKGVSRVMTFHSAARLDGLVRREELVGRKLIETFESRDDRLWYRSATYIEQHLDEAQAALLQGHRTDAASAGATPEPESSVLLPLAPLSPTATKRGSITGKSSALVPMLPIAKMTLKFARDPSVPHDEDIAKKVFYVKDNKIKVVYHYGSHRLTSLEKLYNVGSHPHPTVQHVQMDKLTPMESGAQLMAEMHAVMAAEKAAMQAVRESEREVREMVGNRNKEELGVTLEVAYYDVTHANGEASDGEADDAGSVTESAFDYLTPYWPEKADAVLTREQALEVHQRCLRALKDRLIERANIIQARLTEEKAALARKQAAYKRDREASSPSDEEVHEAEVHAAEFRIQILEKRLKRHEEAALAKYHELDRKLKRDPRLVMLMGDK